MTGILKIEDNFENYQGVKRLNITEIKHGEVFSEVLFFTQQKSI